MSSWSLVFALSALFLPPEEAVRPEMRMGPPPPGYWRITGEPVPGWTPAHQRAARSAMEWAPLGPRPIEDEFWSGTDDASGRVVSIAPHPTDPDTVYAASASGGVWKTEDGGLLWVPLTDELPSLNHGCVTLDPANPETVYVGTGEYTTISTGTGMFRSTDGGGNWDQIATAEEVGATCSRIRVDPSDSQRIHVTGAIGYSRSTDGGGSWDLLLDGRASDLALRPDAPSVLYAAVHGDGVYKSTDGGDSWVELTNGLPASGFTRIVLAMATSSPATVYAAFVTGGSLEGLYKTTDAGSLWTELTNTPNFPSPQAWYDCFVSVDPTDADELYAGGVFPTYAVAGVTKSTDGGGSWDDVTCPGDACLVGPNPHPDMHTLSFGPGGTLWLGNDGGVWKSDDGGETWINTNTTLSVTQNYAIALDPLDESRVMGGTQDNGTVAREQEVEEWPQIVAGDGGFLAYDFTDPNIRYTTYVFLTVFRLVGENVTEISGPWGADPAEFIAPLVMDPNDADTLLGGTNKVWRTQNASGAATWSAISPPVPGTLTALAVAPGFSDTIYAGSSIGDVWVTSDAASWENRSDGLPIADTTDLVVHPILPGIAYASFLATSGARLFKTHNYGVDWVDFSVALPEGVAPRALAVDWRNVPETLYVGSGAGVYWSEDGGETWEKDGSDLPNVNIGDLLIDFERNTLTAGTYGRGVWRALLSEPTGIFGDGFESGDARAWDEVVGE